MGKASSLEIFSVAPDITWPLLKHFLLLLLQLLLLLMLIAVVDVTVVAVTIVVVTVCVGAAENKRFANRGSS